MFKTIKNALKTPDVRKRLLYTLILIVIFRFGCYITVPGVDTIALGEQMKSATGTLVGLINTISGGAFSKLSIFSMTITPYITASIVIQLLGMIIPSLEKLMKEGGEAAKQKINKYTKITALILALVQSLAIFLGYKGTGIFIDESFVTGATIVLSLITGTAILMWLGEQITNKGIGNGISMIIFVGIVSVEGMRLKTLSKLKGRQSLRATIPHKKQLTHFGTFLSNGLKRVKAKTPQVAVILILTIVKNKFSIIPPPFKTYQSYFLSVLFLFHLNFFFL